MPNNSTVMNGTNEHINESSSRERRKNRRPDQCLYQPPGGRQAKTNGVNSSSNLRRTVQEDSYESCQEPLRHESSSRSRTDGRDQESHSFRTSRNSHESRRENSFRNSCSENNENKKPLKTQMRSNASSRRESDEFNKVFAPLFSGGLESSVMEQEDHEAKRTTELSPQRHREMKIKNRSLKTRNCLKKDRNSDDDDGDNAWKSFDRSKVPVKNTSQLSNIQTPKQEHRHSPIRSNPRNKIHSSRRLESPSWEKVTFDLHSSNEVKDLVFVDVDEDEKPKPSRPKPRNGHKLWDPDDGVPTGSRGVIQLPKAFPLKPSEPRPRKAVDPEFVRLPVIKEKSKYICVATAEQQQVGPEMIPKITKCGTANSEGQKSTHLLDAKLSEVSEQGTKLSTLLRKFAGPSCRADSTSDRSTSRCRSHRNDSRSLSHGSTNGISCLSDGEVESLLKDLVQLRRAIGNHLKEIIINHPEVSIKKYLCEALWKLGFYQSIEMFRRMLEDRSKFSNFLMSATRNALLSTITEGIEFYEGFVKDIQSKYSVNLLDPENKGTLFVNSLHLYGNPTDMKLTSAQKLVSIICYQVAINVGDLERYREVQTASSEKLVDPEVVVPGAVGSKHSVDRRMFLEARWWYLKAHQLHAKFGKPFHQLAVISQLMKRRLDAVYFHLRNLHSKNPVESGREELQSIFQGVWKRVTTDEKKRKLEVARRKEKMTRTFKMGSRVEVWIRPNGKRETVDISDDEVEENSPEFLSGMDVIDLNRKFLLDYLVTIGKLYTKIGMESYKTTAVTLLQGFRVLLSSSPIIISEERLYQLLAINMAVIERHKENAIIREEVIALTMDMIGLLCECYFRLIDLLDDVSDNGRSSPAFGTIKELNHIMGAIKVFADWMLGHAQLWSPRISSLLETFGENKVDLWRHLINFFNSVAHVSAKISKDSDSECLELTQVSFPDEEFFRSFMPLMTGNEETKGSLKTVLEEKQMAVARISQLKAIIDALKDQEEPIISLDPITKEYRLCPINDCRLLKSVKNKAMKKDGSDDDDYDIDDEDDDDDVVIISSEVMSAEESEDEKSPEEPMKVISERGLELIVKPKYVVLDTNCLVHNFRNVKILLDSKVFIIIVPLIVIKELEKLEKKGSAQHHPEDKDFNDWLKVQSQLALEFLRREFKSNNRYLRTATINGNIMTSMNFTNEDYTDAKKNLCYNNDDLILVCCTKLCQGPGNETMPTNPSDPEKKNRNVVLVTNDRILRIKAFNEEVPSRNVPKFMQWAGLSKK